MEMTQYFDIFIEESKEHLTAINQQVLLLEKSPEELSIVNEIFRSAHTLKGMSATMGYEDLASLTHCMENVLDSIRNKKISVTTQLLDVLFASLDHLEAMVVEISEGGSGKRDVSKTVRDLEVLEKGQQSMPVSQIDNEPVNSAQTFDQYEKEIILQSKEQGFHAYELSINLRKDCILKAARVYMVFEVIEQIGEIIKAVPAVDMLEAEQFDSDFKLSVLTQESGEEVKQRILKVSEVDKVVVSEIYPGMLNDSVHSESEHPAEKVSNSSETKKENSSAHSTGSTVSGKTIRVNIDRLDQLMNLFEELVIDRGRLEEISKMLKSPELNETVERMNRVSGDLQNIILTMRMVPIEQVFNRFPRMVRGLAKDLAKNVNLEILGAETELDRTVIDEIGDPLVHLLRNSIDHGIEKPAARIAAGKNETGTIYLRAYHSGNHVFIEIEDDGAGINRQRVVDKALENGIITKEMSENLSDKQCFELLFASGFSTAEVISDISGRGVGLDVVKNKIESLGGLITVDSTRGFGTIFSIQLPLTLSIMSAMLVEVQNEKYAIPLSSIIETAIIRKDEILSVHNQKVMDFRGRVVPLVFMKEIFEVPPLIEASEHVPVVVVRKGDKMAALVVDSFIGQQEIVLKSLGQYLSSVFAISGATILGDGQVALILDCNALIK
ncbi:chemotaxis protein CheA [Fictibacillus phosphorivorans]|uniref:chemotaxis protein CheA n=1 Tax=Fictibacillus phosphorivorans TaxID=1221500 RepID=UPI00203E2730|nr:chemotaxis protein CheA [Fictibacillus phosphorivorans]MCM3717138.1 chemotaxis protein CheA [Fictibacillus phosphorivorans]MCM3774825.1 chemotaxis protein CheA [Fictibacillus phosphorivorans]